MKRCIAWCPECFDEMRLVENKNKYGLIISQDYYCEGCDETYEFNKKDSENQASTKSEDEE